MKLSDFDYFLPKELIAQYPLKERDSCRMLILDRKNGLIEHLTFKDISRYFKKQDLLVLNDTKVMPCRLIGARKTGGRVEVFLLKEKSSLTFDVMIKPGRLKLGEKINFNGASIKGTITGRKEISFDAQNADAVYKLGAMPLPPYIKRKAEELDSTYYQTVYAKHEGAVASPTAGLHFTEELLRGLKSAGVDCAYVTLHVGPGTFKPVSVEDITAHKMEAEEFNIPKETAAMIEGSRKSKGRIIAVGTTSLRALETYARGKESGETDLFIYPGYQFKLADCLLTNFHLPRTTLFMLACAFAGEALVKRAYQEAVKEKYRFYSYGDAMLIV